MAINFNSLKIQGPPKRIRTGKRAVYRIKLDEIEKEKWGEETIKPVKGFSNRERTEDEILEERRITKQILKKAIREFETSNYICIVFNNKIRVLNHSGKEIYKWSCGRNTVNIHEKIEKELKYVIKIYKSCLIQVK